MGAQQSSDSSAGPSSAPTVAERTCYYELLSIERDATEEEIKRAYRRKALELHPDRNLERVEYATQRFAEVQTAYEVLSDPQERAWYDSHRESILRGTEDADNGSYPTTYRNVRLTSTEDIHLLISKFNASVPFNDEPSGFFGILRETFAHLALEEEAAADQGEDPRMVTFPSFGSAEDEYESSVKAFYAGWSGFSTRKSFAWFDKYRLSDAPDRRVRRLMEKENKKIRDDAIREFNEAVRFLLAFVRKRDPRYAPNARTDSERQQSMREASAAQAAKARAANQEKMSAYKAPEWITSRDDSGVEDGDTYGDMSDDTEDASEEEFFECVVCDKTFKSEKQLQSHERSKKHLKAVDRLRWQMRKEGTALDLEHEPIESKVDGLSLDDVRPDATAGGINVPRDAVHDASFTENARDNVVENLDPDDTIPSHDEKEESGDDEYAPRSQIEDRLNDLQPDVQGLEIRSVLSQQDEKPVEMDTTPGKKMGKAKAKREKKAAQRRQDETLHRCQVCAHVFESRTKLFDHIKAEDHAAPITMQAVPKAQKYKKRR
ncbi:meiotically up-regulated protein [Emericellopsis atlantica]|uniref:Meiotically up-regulated protein n=1 Tax=Emericellopsis atlantica TaxID=2614577 RepID=A0A9P7ZDH3_9HYPO|nr:meiotically up-regulated protein [Emericellopsis atlantica]KAG9250133.1 meiotically up-regulated protein [Emericellopsis atlantica]